VYLRCVCGWERPLTHEEQWDMTEEVGRRLAKEHVDSVPTTDPAITFWQEG